MAVKMMMFENGSTGPVAVCDVCGKPIRDAAGATVFWLREPDFGEKPGHLYELQLVYLLVNVRLAPNGERFEQAVDMAAMLNDLC